MSAHAWVREYAVQVETVSADEGLELLLSTTDAAAITFGATKIGVGGDGTSSGKFKLLLNNHPDIISNTAITDTPKASGTSERVEESLQALIAQPATFAPEMDCNAYLASLFLQLLLQSGGSQTSVGTNIRDKYIPYSKIDVKYFGAFLGKIQKLAGVVDECELLRGAVATSVKFNASEGETLKISSELIGAKWSNSFNATGIPASSQSVLKKSFLKWQNATVLIEDAYVTEADPTSGLATVYGANMADTTSTKLYAQSFEITLNNNAKAGFFNSETAKCITLGQADITGTLIVPWVVPGLGVEANKYYWNQINEFRNGIVKHIKAFWGVQDGTSDNSLVFDMYVKYTSAPLEGDDVLNCNLGFTCVQPVDGTPAITILCGHTNAALNRGLA